MTQTILMFPLESHKRHGAYKCIIDNYCIVFITITVHCYMRNLMSSIIIQLNMVLSAFQTDNRWIHVVYINIYIYIYIHIYIYIYIYIYHKVFLQRVHIYLAVFIIINMKGFRCTRCTTPVHYCSYGFVLLIRIQFTIHMEL
jgi:hypothetical protein